MKKVYSRVSRVWQITCAVGFCLALGSANLQADPAGAYKVFGETTSLDQLMKKHQDKFYEIKKEEHQLINNSGREEYLQKYWEREGKKTKKTPEEAKNDYMKAHVKVTDAEVKTMLKQYENHPNLKDLSAKDKAEQIKNFLQQKGESTIIQNILDEGNKKGDLVILVEAPKEPVYEVKTTKNDVFRYGPAVSDTTPMKGGCSGDDCKITIVEYSEFQCPFCSRVLPATKQILEAYKGKIRWTVRDFPLSFHQRARPAAIAAKCAANQGKYWEMYYTLFDNQQKLNDSDLTAYAAKIKLDTKKYDECVKKPLEVEKIIDENLNSGLSLGVSGTPAFFINGRRMSGALPPEEFRRIIDEELKKNS